jgi:hypothetical protein
MVIVISIKKNNKINNINKYCILQTYKIVRKIVIFFIGFTIYKFKNSGCFEKGKKYREHTDAIEKSNYFLFVCIQNTLLQAIVQRFRFCVVLRATS